MVQIIKSGSLRRYVRKCQYCGCEFSYNEKDIIHSTNKQFKDGKGKRIASVITCPECYNDIILL